MKKAEVFDFYDEKIDYVLEKIESDWILMNDINAGNFGIINGEVVKIDYGRDFWLYNFYIGIRNILFPSKS